MTPSLVLDNFGLEASREAVDERRRMLAYACAGAFDVTMTIAQAAERTIRELDPEDIGLPRRLRAPSDVDPDASTSDDEITVLIASGCVIRDGRRGHYGGDLVSYQRTTIGELVLKMLRAYEPTSVP